MRCQIALAVVVSFCSGSALAQQQTRWEAMPRGLYLGLQGGLNFQEDNHFRGGGTDGSKAKYDVGPAGTFTFGYALEYGLRVELEGGYRFNSVDEVGGSQGDGRLQIGSTMINAIYDVPLPTFGIPVLPHVGVGVGWNHVWNRSLPHNGLAVSGQDDLFAYQLIAGLDYVVRPNLVAGIDYKYMRGNNASFDIDTGGTSKAGDQASHAVLVGLRYYFGAPPQPAPRAEPAAAPMPPASTAPAPRPMPRNYTLYFDFNRAELDSSAVPIVEQAAATARSGQATRIAVNGHADRSGSDSYNQRLSERRAETVRQALVARGVPAGDIAIVGRGEREPSVPTADGIREPRNRRVEIVLQSAGT
jgi:OmpA-OmpF porin, OOP family